MSERKPYYRADSARPPGPPAKSGPEDDRRPALKPAPPHVRRVAILTPSSVSGAAKIMHVSLPKEPWHVGDEEDAA